MCCLKLELSMVAPMVDLFIDGLQLKNTNWLNILKMALLQIIYCPETKVLLKHISGF